MFRALSDTLLDAVSDKSWKHWHICIIKFSYFQNVLLVSSNLPKNQRNLSRISALAKNKGTLHHQLEDYIFDSLTLLFWFGLFLQAGAEILEKISLVFWKIWRHQKDILEWNLLSFCCLLAAFLMSFCMHNLKT